MTRSHWQANEYMKVAKMTQADVDREKAVQDEIDASAKRYRIKERLCFLSVCLGYLAIGVFGAYCFYVRQS